MYLLTHTLYSNLPVKYATWTWDACAYLTGRCVLNVNMYMYKKDTIDLKNLKIFCVLNWDAYLNGCVLNREITVCTCNAIFTSPAWMSINQSMIENKRRLVRFSIIIYKKHVRIRIIKKIRIILNAESKWIQSFRSMFIRSRSKFISLKKCIKMCIKVCFF